jgi:hypothetical protein
MKGVAWGELYNQFNGKTFDTDALEKRVAKLMLDEDVERKVMAEREGFEPPIPFQVCRFSRPEPSTTRPPLRGSHSFATDSILW